MSLELGAAIAQAIHAEHEKIQWAIADFVLQLQQDLQHSSRLEIDLFQALKMQGIWLEAESRPAVRLEANEQAWILTRPYARGYKIRKENYKPLNEEDLSTDCLSQGLLLLIGREQEHRAKQQELDLRAQESERATQEQYQRTLEAEKRHLGVVDQQVRDRIDAQVDGAKQELWQWPDRLTLVLYKVEWFSGGYRDQDGESCFSYASGWSLSDRLDDDGYIRLLPEKKFQHPGEIASYTDERLVRLIPEVHFPVFEKRELRSVDDLPDCFTEKVYLKIKNVWEFLALDGTSFLVDQPGRGDGYIIREVGEVPVSWIRESLTPRFLRLSLT